MIWQRKKFIVAENNKFKETDKLNSVQSSLRYHPSWVTLFYSKTVTVIL